MNPGQQQFFDYILERVDTNNHDKAIMLMRESFDKLNKGEFNRIYATTFIPKVLQLIKPEFVEEVQSIMQKFAGDNH